MNPGKRRGRVAALGVRRRPVVKPDLQQDELHADHDEGLDQESSIVFRSGIVEDPVGRVVCQIWTCLCDGYGSQARTYLMNDATNMMSGMSSENPALDRLRYIE